MNRFSPLCLLLAVLLAPMARAQSESVAIHPCQSAGNVTRDAGRLRSLQSECTQALEELVTQAVPSNDVGDYLTKKAAGNCARARQPATCLTGLASGTQATHAVLVTLNLDRNQQVKSIKGIAVNKAKANLVTEKTVPAGGNASLSDALGTLLDALGVPTRPPCKENITVTPEDGSEIVLPIQTNGVLSKKVPVQARLMLCKGGKPPERLDFKVSRSDGGAWGSLGEQKDDKRGSYAIDWTPGEDGKYSIQVSHPQKALSKTVSVTVRTKTIECGPYQEATGFECRDRYSSLVLETPEQDKNLVCGQLVPVQARLKLNEGVTAWYPEGLDLVVTRSEGGVQKKLGLPKKDDKGTYTASWTPTEAGEYTLEVVGGGLTSKTQVKIGICWKKPTGYALVGVGAAGLVVSSIFVVQAINANSELAKLYENDSAPHPSLQDKVASLRKDADKGVPAGVGAALSVASVAGGLGLLLSEPKPDVAPGSASLSVGPGGVSLRVLLP